MQLQAIIQHIAERLQNADIPNPHMEARVLLAHVYHLPIEQLLMQDRPLADKTPEIEAYIARRIAREPLAYITGEREFWSLNFVVNRHTLIPRPETELMVEAVLKRVPKSFAGTILDLGTGSGCILLSLLHELPNAHGIGVDASAGALETAALNASNHGINRVSWLQGNWCEGITQKCDIIVSNPPYITEADYAGLMPEVLRFEPSGALIAGKDGLDCYREIAKQIPHVLQKEGFLVLEIGQHQQEAVTAILNTAGMKVASVIADLSGIPRTIVATF